MVLEHRTQQLTSPSISWGELTAKGLHNNQPKQSNNLIEILLLKNNKYSSWKIIILVISNKLLILI